MIISVLGHTHTLNNVDELPSRAKLALAGSDLVLHVGNVGNLVMLRGIQDKAGLTFAVYGPKDDEDVRRYLDVDKVVEFANRRIAIVYDVGKPEQSLKNILRRATPSPTVMAENLLNRFSDVDCILFGSPNQPFNHIHKGVLCFNPGPVTHENGGGGTMGILEITERAMTGRILTL